MKKNIIIWIMVLLLSVSAFGLSFSFDSDPLIADADSVVYQVKNGELTPLSVLDVVYATGSDGIALTVERAIASDIVNSEKVICVVNEPIGIGATGSCTVLGKIGSIDTSAFVEGDELYLSGTTEGDVETVPPTPGDRYVSVGIVIRSNPINGTIDVNLRQNPFMVELSDFNNSATTNENDFMKFYDGLWQPFDLSTQYYSIADVYNKTEIDNQFSLVPYIDEANVGRLLESCDYTGTCINQTGLQTAVAKTITYGDSGQYAISNGLNGLLYVDTIPESDITGLDYFTNADETDPLSYHTDENINATGYNISADTITSYGNNVASYQLTINGSNSELKWLR